MNKNKNTTLLLLLLTLALSACTNQLDPLDADPEQVYPPITLGVPTVKVSTNGADGNAAATRAAGDDITRAAAGEIPIIPMPGSNFILELIDKDGDVVATTRYLFSKANPNVSGSQPGWAIFTKDGAQPITVTGGARQYRARAYGIIGYNDGEMLYAASVGAIDVSADGSFSLTLAPQSARIKVILRNATGSPVPSPNGEWYTVTCTGIPCVDMISGGFDLSKLPVPGGTWTLTPAANPWFAGSFFEGNFTIAAGYFMPGAHTATKGIGGTYAPADTGSNTTLFSLQKKDAGVTPIGSLLLVPFPSYIDAAGTVQYRSFTLAAGKSYTFTLLIDGEQVTIQRITVGSFEEGGEIDITLGEKPATRIEK